MADFLEWFYPDRPPENYNLEEVLAYLDISRARLPLWGLKDPITQRFDKEELYISLLGFVRERLAIPPGELSPLHERLLDPLEENDSVITTNYDLIVDQVYRERERIDGVGNPGIGRYGKTPGLIGHYMQDLYPSPTLREHENQKGFYLKLHGSLDWLYCLTPGCQNNSSIYPAGVWEENPRFSGRPCRNCGAALVTFIVPPVATKRLEDRSRMAFIWRLALQELWMADNLVFVGLSLPPSDFELRWLIRQAIALRGRGGPEIKIVNPNADHRSAIKKMLPRIDVGVREFASIFEYLDSLGQARGPA